MYLVNMVYKIEEFLKGEDHLRLASQIDEQTRTLV